MNNGRALINKCKALGWLQVGNRLVTPTQAKQLNLRPEKKPRGKINRTGDTTDTRNIRNKAKYTDQFTRLIEIELGISVWPEFSFAIDRNWRFDYCLPDHHVAVECEGGIYSGGRHVRGKGYENDLEKYNRASADGWTLIRVTPSQLLTIETINLIKKAIASKS